MIYHILLPLLWLFCWKDSRYMQVYGFQLSTKMTSPTASPMISTRNCYCRMKSRDEIFHEVVHENDPIQRRRQLDRHRFVSLLFNGMMICSPFMILPISQTLAVTASDFTDTDPILCNNGSIVAGTFLGISWIQSEPQGFIIYIYIVMQSALFIHCISCFSTSLSTSLSIYLSIYLSIS